MANLLSIDGVVVKKPTDFGVERFNLTKSGRVASGKMTMELVAKKRKLTFAYDVIAGKDLEKLLSILDTDKMFFPVAYVENGKQHTIVVYVGAIKYKKFRSDQGWYWKNLTFDLIQQ